MFISAVFTLPSLGVTSLGDYIHKDLFPNKVTFKVWQIEVFKGYKHASWDTLSFESAVYITATKGDAKISCDLYAHCFGFYQHCERILRILSSQHFPQLVCGMTFFSITPPQVPKTWWSETSWGRRQHSQPNGGGDSCHLALNCDGPSWCFEWHTFIFIVLATC